VVSAALVLALRASASSAHHGYTHAYDPAKRQTVTGTLTKVDWRNPHITLVLEVKGVGDRVDNWLLEAAPPIYFVRQNVSKTVFQNAVGQTLTIEVHPARDGSPRGVVLKATFPGGVSVTNDPGV
jgi:hypothetical protein